MIIPPRISNSGMGGARPVILKEKENLMLTCATSGDPKPTVSWARKDGLAVIDGPYKRGGLRTDTQTDRHFQMLSGTLQSKGPLKNEKKCIPLI